MKIVLVTGTLLLAALFCFAAGESKVSRAAILAVEKSIDTKFTENIADPYDLLSTAHGTYCEGYGTVFTFEVALVNVTPPSPFRPVISLQEAAQINSRKQKKLQMMRPALRELIANAARTLEGLPPEEHIAMEGALWRFSGEDPRNLPNRVFMSGVKQNLLDALANHTDLSTVVEEQDR